MNFLRGKTETGGVSLECGLKGPVDLNGTGSDTEVTVGVRPEALGVSLDGNGDVTAQVNSFEQLGAITYIYSELKSGERLTLQLPSQIPLARGQEIGVTMPTDRLHVFSNEDHGRTLANAKVH
ncbi:MAG: TOBE domain-containing protein [Pseudomonadota bacterium]